MSRRRIAAATLFVATACASCGGGKTNADATVGTASPNASVAVTLPTASPTPAAESSTPTKAPQPTPPPQTPDKTSAPGDSTGIRGRVVAGPTCPVERADSPCPDRPVAAADVTITGQGFSGNRTTNGQGVFSIDTPPGRFTMTTSASGVFGCNDESATVAQGHITRVTITCDTGIR